MAPYINWAFVPSSPQPMWADLLVICTGILLAVAVVMVAAGWERHLSWSIRLSAPLTLAGGVATVLAAHYLYYSHADALINGYIKSTGYIVYASGRQIGTTASAPQLMWADLLVICACVLVALSLRILAVSWERHLSWRVRLTALLPLAASVAALLAAHHL